GPGSSSLNQVPDATLRRADTLRRHRALSVDDEDVKANWQKLSSRQELTEWLLKACAGRVLAEDGSPLSRTALREMLKSAPTEARTVRKPEPGETARRARIRLHTQAMIDYLS